MRPHLRVQVVEQGLGAFQVGAAEALGGPVEMSVSIACRVAHNTYSL